MSKCRRVLLAIVIGLHATVAVATDTRLQAPGFPDRVLEFLEGASLVMQGGDDPETTTQDKLASALADYGRLTAALYELGHYGGTVNILVDGREAATISPFESLESIDQIVIRINAGPLFTIGTARIAPVATGTSLPDGFRKDQPARSLVISETATAAIDGWRHAGHAKAEISRQDIVAHHPTSKLHAKIDVAPGPRLRFGDLRLEQPSRVRDSRIREIAGLPTGSVFDPDALDKSATRLRRTGAFRSVSLTEAEKVRAGDLLDINAALEDAKPRRVGFGAEVSSLEGVTLSAFWLHRNLFGGAERLRFDGEISGIGGDSGGEDYRFSVRFERPATFRPDTTFFLGATVEELDEPEFRERNARIGAGFSQIFSETLSGELGIAYQYTEIDDALGSRTLEHIILPGTLTYDSRDDELNATDGIYLGLEAAPFAGIGDEVAGARLLLDARSYTKLGQDADTVLALRAQLGTVFGASLGDVPADMLFYSGGAGTVRGQPYQSLGVDLGAGDLIGGRSFAALSTELRYSLFGPWSVVGFADAGFIAEGSFGENNGEWHAGGGFGVRYDTGFGPIRADVATPLDSDAGEDFELYIGIGQAF